MNMQTCILTKIFHAYYQLFIHSEGASSVALLKVSSLFFLCEFLGEFFLIRCEVKGQGCRMCTDCKAL